MKIDALLTQMEGFPQALQALLAGTSTADARWRPPGGGWSLLEIVAHMEEEERQDFRPRVRSTLEDPERAWPSIDPEGWVSEHAYNEGDLVEALAALARERAASLEWLRALDAADWDRAHVHPLGVLRAGDLLTAWVAHDSLHLRQLAGRRLELTRRDAEPFHAKYAGG